jgi:chromosomal replication initiator protein
VRGYQMVDRKEFGPRDEDRTLVDDVAAETSAEPLSARDAELASREPAASETEDQQPKSDVAQLGLRVRAVLKARLGEEVFTSWFGALEFHEFDGVTLRVSVPTRFLKSWIQSQYGEALQACAAIEFKGLKKVDVVLRQPGGTSQRPGLSATVRPVSDGAAAGPRPMVQQAMRGAIAAPPAPRSVVNGLEGSPLDPRYTFESFVVGPPNRMSHAGATQVAETVFAESRGFNPLFIHSGVGHGKTHLLHAIAWEVKRRTPHAQVLYLTAERFRFQFVEAVKGQDAMAFKERFRAIDMLLIDDLEFLQGEKTELEFDHIINMLLDGGRQLVVASARPPSQLTRLNDRMRSRLGRGLVTEINNLDYELRLKILERRVQEKRSVNPSFEIPRDALELLADKLTESGRELEGAVTRLYATWQYMGTTITLEVVNSVIHELVNGIEPRRIKIEDILRIVSRHYGVSRNDLLSPRRQRSVVRPRQIGMYLAKQLTSRSLPEIGRRFGNRDHTTVLHAIRKISDELSGNARLKDEIEELKKQLAN